MESVKESLIALYHYTQLLRIMRYALDMDCLTFNSVSPENDKYVCNLASSRFMVALFSFKLVFRLQSTDYMFCKILYYLGYCRQMQPIATVDCQFVCLSVMTVVSLKVAELIMMAFGIWTRVSLRHHILDGRPYLQTRRGNFEGKKGASPGHARTCLAVTVLEV